MEHMENVDRRRESRVAPLGPIYVEVLGEGQRSMRGEVVDTSAHGMGLRLPSPVPAGTPIKIEFADELILGEVSYCALQEATYRVGLRVKHRVRGWLQLQRLHRALHAETASVPLDESASSIIER